jgi:hypothetical protein
VNHKENRVFKFALSIVCLLVVTLGQASAGPIITEPTSLSPGIMIVAGCSLRSLLSGQTGPCAVSCPTFDDRLRPGLAEHER